MTSVRAHGSIGHVSEFQKMLLSHSLQPGDRVVDATLGNGNDALMLLNLIGKTGFLYGFDLQAEALTNSKILLHQHGYTNYKLIQDCHSKLTTYVQEPIKGYLFNLGYLPKGNKLVTTLWQTTQIAISQAMNTLSSGGFIGIMTYPGHENGMIEDLEIQSFFSKIDQNKYQIVQTQFINQKNNPPKYYWLSKRE